MIIEVATWEAWSCPACEISITRVQHSLDDHIRFHVLTDHKLLVRSTTATGTLENFITAGTRQTDIAVLLRPSVSNEPRSKSNQPVG